MDKTTEDPPTLASLVPRGLAHGRIFTDEKIYSLEIQRLFRRAWLYIGHESEVSSVGDYVLKDVAEEPLIVTRGEDGVVRVLINRCRHRGSTVCQATTGNATYFRCHYHGWTYSSSGDLVGLPHPDAYGVEGLDRVTYGLSTLPRLDTYRGFIFGSFSGGGVSLRDHLGEAAHLIDAFCDASPLGSVSLSAGVQRTKFMGNWKFVGMDGYHAPSVHKSVKELVDTRTVTKRELWKEDKEHGRNYAASLGGGHARLFEEKRNVNSAHGIVGDASIPQVARDEYIASMRAAYGSDADRNMASSQPHVAVFPNLQLIGNHVRTVRPRGAGLTEVDLYPALLDGVPAEINRSRIQAHSWFYGPAGFGQPDDAEVFERCERGLSGSDPWVLLSRGLHREETDDRGVTIGNRTDEVTQRAQLSEWLRYVETPIGTELPDRVASR